MAARAAETVRELVHVDEEVVLVDGPRRAGVDVDHVDARRHRDPPGALGVVPPGEHIDVVTDSSERLLAYFDSDAASASIDRMLYTDVKTRLADHLLMVTDRMKPIEGASPDGEA